MSLIYANLCTFPDNEAPVISAISDANMGTSPGLQSAEVSWEKPAVTDNSGEDVTLTSDYNPGDRFPVGTTTVTYTATDIYGNKATSQFHVIVTGMLICFVFMVFEVMKTASKLFHCEYFIRLCQFSLKKFKRESHQCSTVLLSAQTHCVSHRRLLGFVMYAIVRYTLRQLSAMFLGG